MGTPLPTCGVRNPLERETQTTRYADAVPCVVATPAPRVPCCPVRPLLSTVESRLALGPHYEPKTLSRHLKSQRGSHRPRSLSPLSPALHRAYSRPPEAPGQPPGRAPQPPGSQDGPCWRFLGSHVSLGPQDNPVSQGQAFCFKVMTRNPGGRMVPPSRFTPHLLHRTLR